MIIRFDYKPKGEKLLRFKIDYDETNNFIKKINIFGDFFIHPEDEIESIEKAISNEKFVPEKLREKLEKLIRERDIQLVGISIDGIVEGITKALESK
ncbi:MAG: lipoate protein ligase C-terminal domain-containing protein [Candidatus Asgardarchaeia archaeon]